MKCNKGLYKRIPICLRSERKKYVIHIFENNFIFSEACKHGQSCQLQNKHGE